MSTPHHEPPAGLKILRSGSQPVRPTPQAPMANQPKELPEPPEWLEGDALEMFEQVAPLLHQRGVMFGALSMSTVVAYCLAWAAHTDRAQAYARAAASTREFTDTSNQLLRWSRALQLTPADIRALEAERAAQLARLEEEDPFA